MKKIRYGYSPTHPGEVIKDEIESRKISQRQLSEMMGVSYKIINDILNEKRQLTVSMAMMFEAALDIPADALMQLQLKYNMQRADNDVTLRGRLNKIRQYVAFM